MFFRSLVGLIGFTAATFGIPLVPLVVFNTTMNTAPIWASILGWFFLKEKMLRTEVFALVLSFIGVLMIAFSNSEPEKSQSEERQSEADGA